MTAGHSEIHALLQRWNAGDLHALDSLTPVVYDELRRLARSLLARERPGHTLTATELVHEVYVRLADSYNVQWQNRAHFFGAAANIMRRVLVDHAKRKFSQKRGGESRPLSLSFTRDAASASLLASEEILALDAALDQLGRLDPRKARVVEMKFFGGLTNLEIAQTLQTSEATVDRDWRMARAWLIQSLGAP